MILPINGHAIQIPMADGSVHCAITSPPYWGLRDYGLPPLVWPDGWRGCLGLEPSPDLYVEHLVQVFREVRRVLRADGTLWLNIGDSYAGSWGNYAPGGIKNEQRPQTEAGQRWDRPAYSDTKFRPPSSYTGDGLKPKDLCLIPFRVASALQADGWWLRSVIVWHKPNCMPESVTDRPTTAHEYVFLLAKSQRYFYDAEAIKEPVAESTIGRGPVDFGGAKGRNYKPDKNDPNYRGGNEQWGRTFDYKESCATGRNKRTVWTIPTFPFSGAHFATFPPALIEPMVKAGTSERGCCPECGGPWERVVDSVDTGKRQKMADGWDTGPGGHGSYHRSGREKGETDKPVMANVTTGWQPTCQHDHDPIPATVFDPFVGSGTTLMVARQLGRRGVGLDLSAAYLAEQARERLGLAALDAWENGKDGAGGEPLETLPLFAEAIR